jgi:hypothetical protein
MRLPESPKFLHSKHRFEKAHESLQYIASANGIENYNIKFYQENRPDEAQEPSMSLLEAMEEKIFLQNLLIMAFNWMV